MWVTSSPSYAVAFEGRTQPARLCRRMLGKARLCDLHRFMSRRPGSLTGEFLFLLLPNGSLPFLATGGEFFFLIDGSVFCLLFEMYSIEVVSLGHLFL